MIPHGHRKNLPLREEMPSTKEESFLFPLLVLVGLWVVFHSRVLFCGHAEVLLDSSRFFYPLWKWGAGVWKQGLIPLWNPDAAFGTPYLADPQMACWYPPLVFLYFLFPPTTAFTLLILGHHLWALTGFFLFARNRGFSPWTAVGGGLVFGFSFNAVSLVWITSMFFTFSWIPWVFLASDRLWEGKRGSFLLFLNALAMQMAAGYPLLAYLTGLTLGMDWFLRALTGRKEAQRARLALKAGWGFLAVGLAVLYNAAWLVPLMEMIPLSNLTQRVTMTQGMDWSNLATWLNPFSKGHPLFSHPDTPFSYIVYFAGLPTMVIVLWGAVRGKVQRSSLFLFGTVLLLSLGEKAWVGGWLKHILPGYVFVVRSGYWMPLMMFATAVIFMEAFQVFSTSPIEKITPPLERVIWIILAAITYFSALVLGVPLELPSFWVSFLLIFLAGWLPSEFASGNGRRILILLSLLFSLGPVDRGIHFTMKRSYYDPPEVVRKLSQGGRIYQPSSFVDALGTISGNGIAEAYEGQKGDLAPNLPLGYGREEVSYVNTLCLASFLKWYLWEGNDPPREALDYLNVRYFVGTHYFIHSKRISGDGNGIQVLENLEVVPKWFSVHRASPSSGTGNISSLAGELTNDFKGKCIILNPSQSGNYSLREVRETFRNPSQIKLEAYGKGKALLVSSETAYPGWAAEINGRWRPLEDVNGGFRGLVLQDGEEKAAVVFRPNSFRFGFFFSLLVCGLWTAMLLNQGWKRNNA